ncbi:TauD/TfdA family dioxygenase [Verticiella sediminum]|uniref:TauD/TfdA family dioxygenase n=1 Tax=Verticiella sediminum TaxID=1247510 RepID=A0A556ABS6_9BURK|nr:TauD/TfdA family dioxygenase [Verticiella sediminum]TSH90344.1 TauD/TfdA family dioxygenase [Verticiella sediminum]
MAELSHTPVTGPAVWRPDDAGSDPSTWRYVLDAAQQDALREAAVRYAHVELADLKAGDVRALLAPLVPLAEQLKRDLGSRGFALVRGVPIHDMDQHGAGRAFWALGMLLGTGLTQNADGDLLCPVTDAGVEYATLAQQTQARGYQSRARADYHVDPTDVVGLLCVRAAKSGGESSIVSTSAIYNEILAHHPEHLAVLTRRFPYSRKGQQAPDESPVTDPIPIFVRHATRVSCRYTRSYILGGAQVLGRELSAQEMDALACFEAIAGRRDMALSMAFEPGDIQFLNNFLVVHGRTAYEDHPEPHRRRFLYRLWLDMGDAEPWCREDMAMRRAHARFGNLGRTAAEWAVLRQR